MWEEIDKEILRGMAAGKTNGEIGQDLGMSRKQVRRRVDTVLKIPPAPILLRALMAKKHLRDGGVA